MSLSEPRCPQGPSIFRGLPPIPHRPHHHTFTIKFFIMPVRLLCGQHDVNGPLGVSATRGLAQHRGAHLWRCHMGGVSGKHTKPGSKKGRNDLRRIRLAPRVSFSSGTAPMRSTANACQPGGGIGLDHALRQKIKRPTQDLLSRNRTFLLRFRTRHRKPMSLRCRRRTQPSQSPARSELLRRGKNQNCANRKTNKDAVLVISIYTRA